MASWIKLVVRKPLDKASRKSWYACVHAHVPSGVLHHTQIPGSDSITSSAYYTKKLTNGHHAYVIPLVRDLVHHEVYQIAHAWDAQWPQVDFVIDYSQPADHTLPQHADVPAHKIAQVMDAWGKQQHDAWMKEKVDQGWRYGVHMSLKDRTHPWIQPWESLPAQARQPHVQAVKDLVQLLQQFGYKIVQSAQA